MTATITGVQTQNTLSLSGQFSGPFELDKLIIANDTLDVGSDFADMWTRIHNFQAGKGGRNTEVIFQNRTGPTDPANQNTNYCAHSANNHAYAGDNGTPQNPRGGHFCYGSVAWAHAGALNLQHITWAEANVIVEQGASVWYKAIQTFVSPKQDKVRGFGYDTIHGYSDQVGACGHDNVWLVGHMNGQFPVQDGNILRVIGPPGAQVRNGFVFEVPITNRIIDAPSFYLGAGGFGMLAPNAGLEQGSVSVANVPYHDYHSSGFGNDYDSRTWAWGGTATTGEGGYAISGGYFYVMTKCGMTLTPLSADPIAADGTIYYNGALGKFRKKAAGAWSDL